MRKSRLINWAAMVILAGIVVALLLPAMTVPRGPHLRARCQNNLRQLAIAAQAHQTVHKRLPSLVGYYGIHQPSSEQGTTPTGLDSRIASFRREPSGIVKATSPKARFRR